MKRVIQYCLVLLLILSSLVFNVSSATALTLSAQSESGESAPTIPWGTDEDTGKAIVLTSSDFTIKPHTVICMPIDGEGNRRQSCCEDTDDYEACVAAADQAMGLIGDGRNEDTSWDFDLPGVCKEKLETKTITLTLKGKTGSGATLDKLAGNETLYLGNDKAQKIVVSDGNCWEEQTGKGIKFNLSESKCHIKSTILDEIDKNQKLSLTYFDDALITSAELNITEQ